MGRIRYNQYGRDAVLEEKGEMSYAEIVSVLQKREMEAKKLIDAGWEHVLYAMKKYGLNGQLSGIDLMMVPMHEEQFEFVAKRCRNVIVYALHRR